MKKKFYQLVHHNETTFEWYGIHEALIENGNIYWVGAKPVRKFDNYHAAVKAWARAEPLSMEVDIMDYQEAKALFDKLDYSDHEELEF